MCYILRCVVALHEPTHPDCQRYAQHISANRPSLPAVGRLKTGGKLYVFINNPCPIKVVIPTIGGICKALVLPIMQILHFATLRSE